MTANANLIKAGIINGQGYHSMPMPCADGTSSFNAGDLVYWDSSANLIKAVGSTDAHALTLAGVALQPSKVSSSIDNSSISAPSRAVIGWGGIFNLKMTSGDTYYHANPVYVGADSQTITNTQGSLVNVIGYVCLPDPILSTTGVPYAAGGTIPVLVLSKLFAEGTAVAADVAALGGTLTGTVTGSMVEVGTLALSTSGGNTYSDTAVNTGVNTLITAIRLEFKELQSKVNAILTALKNAGLMG